MPSYKELEWRTCLLKAEAELEGMKIANYERRLNKYAPAYTDMDFNKFMESVQNTIGEIRMMKED